MILTIIIFLLVLSVLVLVHELGHFLAARKYGAAAEEFGLGFPPRLAGFYKTLTGNWRLVWGNREVTDAADTVYSLNLVPLGGFVKIRGENGEDKTDVSSFSAKKIWQRAIIMSAGVTMNVILAAILISVNLMIGSPQIVEDVPQGAIVSDRRIQIMSVLPDRPAEAAEVRAGDAIISIDGQKFATYAEVQKYVDGKVGQSVTYELQRGQETMTKEITPVALEEAGRAGIGITIAETASVRYPWYQAIIEGVKLTGIMLWAIIAGFYELISRLITGGGVSADVTGPVGIAVLTGQVVDLGFAYLLQFAALLSLNLAVINFLPFPALDGGRVLFLIIEKLKGRPVNQRVEAVIHNVGFLLLIGLVLLVTFRDVVRLF